MNRRVSNEEVELFMLFLKSIVVVGDAPAPLPIEVPDRPANGGSRVVCCAKVVTVLFILTLLAALGVGGFSIYKVANGDTLESGWIWGIIISSIVTFIMFICCCCCCCAARRVVGDKRVKFGDEELKL